MKVISLYRIELYVSGRARQDLKQGQEAASWPREPAGQAYGTGFLYKVQRIQGVQGSKLSMYKHSLANINNRF